ncbi:hypothetical protein D3C87_953850 [compost metagenome]
MSVEMTGALVLSEKISGLPSHACTRTFPTTSGAQPTPFLTKKVTPSSSSCMNLARLVSRASPTNRHASSRICSRSSDAKASSPNLASTLRWRNNVSSIFIGSPEAFQYPRLGFQLGSIGLGLPVRCRRLVDERPLDDDSTGLDPDRMREETDNSVTAWSYKKGAPKSASLGC